MIAVLRYLVRSRGVLSRTVLFCAACALALSGCGGSADAEPSVLAAFYPLAFAAAQVVPPGTPVTNLTPPGAEPHDLELTARDIERVGGAMLVVYAGGFQPALDDAVAERDGPTLDVLEGAELLTDGAGGRPDPHVWLDPLRYAAVARSIAAALHRPAAAEPLVRRLRALDHELDRGLARCQRRQLVTSHAAFAYLADRYDLQQVPLVGITPEAEPGAREVERLVDEVRRTGATTVFFEPLASPRLARTVAREAAVSTAVLDPLEGLTPEQAGRGADYFSVMRENLAALRSALGCA